MLQAKKMIKNFYLLKINCKHQYYLCSVCSKRYFQIKLMRMGLKYIFLNRCISDKRLIRNFLKNYKPKD